MRMLLIATSALVVGCMHPRAIQAPQGVQLTPLKTISTFHARVLLALSGVKGISVSNSIDCYRVQYAIGPDGKVVQLSGLLALPRGVAPRRLVSFQHGTTTTRSAVPSQPDGTGLAAAIVFAGNGYALVAPDYPGLGESAGRHPYYVADEIGPAVAAMIEASAATGTRAQGSGVPVGVFGGRMGEPRCASRPGEQGATGPRLRASRGTLMTFGVCRCQQR